MTLVSQAPLSCTVCNRFMSVHVTQCIRFGLQGGEAQAGVHHLRAVLTAAGRHALVVSLRAGGSAFAPVPPRGAPAALLVVPGPAAGRRTAVRDLPRLVTAGVAAEFAVCPADAFGNAGASGGDFAAELVPAPGAGSRLQCAIDETAPGGAPPWQRLSCTCVSTAPYPTLPCAGSLCALCALTVHLIRFLCLTHADPLVQKAGHMHTSLTQVVVQSLARVSNGACVAAQGYAC